MNTSAEYMGVVSEYEKPLGKFFLSLSIVTDEDGDILRVGTMEDAVFDVKVNLDGWFVVGSDAEIRVFPTFEGLAMEISSHFRDVWWREVNRGLEKQ
ncbi:DEKNAAC104117 [Brettanomyces naardenensis]|uniref:DEKNAAC104117 n=1 Tax=Brettanomyces naardenensis TaxID=13370 RepID=A0A448YQ97_BRENA|nr:DEKNAAC104117 [Brettanomyces naardenensis]